MRIRHCVGAFVLAGAVAAGSWEHADAAISTSSDCSAHYSGRGHGLCPVISRWETPPPAPRLLKRPRGKRGHLSNAYPRSATPRRAPRCSRLLGHAPLTTIARVTPAPLAHLEVGVILSLADHGKYRRTVKDQLGTLI